MKNKLAKFGIFSTTDSGADYLVVSRDVKGNPLMTYEQAIEMLNIEKKKNHEYEEKHGKEVGTFFKELFIRKI